MISELFREILYRPLFNILIFLYETVAFRDLGLAIILFTILIRLILFPLFHKTAKHQKLSQKLQPEIKEIQKRYKDDREAQTKAIIELYQKNKLSPFTPFGLLLLQLPILIALYRIFINGFNEGVLGLLYSFVPRPESFNQTLFGLIRLDEVSWLLVVIATGLQYLQGRLAFKPQAMGAKNASMLKFTALLFPALTLLILMRFPAALALYWSTSTGFSIIQQVIVNRDGEAKGKNREPRKANGVR
ncbi:MAG: YidC/Oxa1 family membrane protein insertase [Candidatus Colwellbacteria bacterium]|nr:YidC/Oxa1 family membrane protein insertase [Candidatus Colwellbacteria bacterium]